MVFLVGDSYDFLFVLVVIVFTKRMRDDFAFFAGSNIVPTTF
jgi:hypothetical protein